MRVLLFLLLFLCTAPIAQAAETITFRYRHHLFYLNPDSYSSWRADQEVWTYSGTSIVPRPHWRVDGDSIPTLPEGVVRNLQEDWNLSAIAETVRQKIGKQLNKPPGSVAISRSASGDIVFDGVGMPGREVDVDATALLIVQAIEQGITDIFLPVTELQPEVTVLDAALQRGGIAEVVTLGESDFSGSTWNRIHNIRTGLGRFSGHLIPQGSTFSFNEILGPVNARTGYRRELVILGDRTLPEYGGGLCQVSTTAYRGIWEHGFPIAQRRNHSFAVSYYSPQGTDATIYPPHTDMKFVNDGPSDLLIQTHIDVPNRKAYFIYYGTKDNRSTDILGPYTWGHRSPPPQRTEYTTDLAPGQKKKVGSPVAGMKSAWFRVVYPPSASDDLDPEEIVESYYSTYQARPLFYQIGAGTAQQTPAEPAEPTWFGPATQDVSVPLETPVHQEPLFYRPSKRSFR